MDKIEQQSSRKMIYNLYDFLQEPEVDIESLSIEEVRKELKDKNIDTSKSILEIKKQIKNGEIKIITLCGSIRFEKEFHEVENQLTLDGNIVLSCGVFGVDEEYKEMLDIIHKHKIDISDEIFVINVGGYIGHSTLSEILYAKSKNKVIKYLKDSG